MNKVTLEWLINLCVLLGVLINWLIPVVPRNKNALASLHNVPKVTEEGNLLFLEIKPNLHLDRKKWQYKYLSNCKNVVSNGLFVVEHFCLVYDNSYMKWKYPSIHDICEVEAKNILCGSVGNWDVAKDQKMIFYRIMKLFIKIFHDYNRRYKWLIWGWCLLVPW